MNVAENERLSALPFVQSLDLPSAEYGVDRRMPVATKHTAASEWQLVDPGERKSMGTLGRRNKLGQLIVLRIQITRSFMLTRERVGAIQRKTACESFDYLKLE